MTKHLYRKPIKFFVYAAIVFAAYIIQTTPGLFEFCGIKPILVLPACICIAVFEGEFSGGLFGFVFGLFCDSASETVFGFNALLFLVFCVFAGLATIYIFMTLFYIGISHTSAVRLTRTEGQRLPIVAMQEMNIQKRHGPIIWILKKKMHSTILI